MRKQVLHPRTASINTKQKIQAKLARHHALRWLAATFPQVFDNRAQIQPLKIGIMDDILNHADLAATNGISKSKLREAVVLFTRRIDYLTCLKAREIRIDLEGNPVSQVTPEEAECATLKIKKRIEKCAKNVRKQTPSKTNTPKTATAIAATNNHSTPTTQPVTQPTLTPHHYPEYAPSFRTQQQTPAPSARTTSVIIKPSRAYDPEAVARLKEKLGLSRKEEEELK